MAERRMFCKVITESDAFQDMPLSSQALYFHLGMSADDDGFVNSPRKIQRMIGASDDDMKILIGKRFILLFESGIVVIKHWRMNNYIQKDRYKETTYLEEKRTLFLDEKGAYTDDPSKAIKCMDAKCIQDVSIVYTQDSIGKDSIDKNSIEEKENNLKEKDLISIVENKLGRTLGAVETEKILKWEYSQLAIMEALETAIQKQAKYPVDYANRILLGNNDNKINLAQNNAVEDNEWLRAFKERHS